MSVIASIESNPFLGPNGVDPKSFQLGSHYTRNLVFVLVILAFLASTVMGSLGLWSKCLNISHPLSMTLFVTPSAISVIALIKSRYSKIDTSFHHPRLTGQIAVDQFIANAVNKGRIEWEMSQITDREIDDLLRLMDEHSVNHEDPKLPYLALKALQRGRINDHQAGTLIQFHSAFLFHKKANFDQCFPDNYKEKPQGDVIPQRYSFNEDSASFVQKTYTHFGSRPIFGLTSQQYDLFVQLVKTLPKSEQQFLLVKDVEVPSETQKIKTSRVAAAQMRFNVFGAFEDKEHQRYRMIPSIGLMQTYLYARFGAHATNIIPISTAVGPEMIARDWEHQSHVLCIPSYAIQSKSRIDLADGFYFPFYDFTIHDFYHCLIGSFVPERHKKLYVKLWRAFPKGANKQKSRFQFIDMEHPLYYTGLEPNQNTIFLRTAILICINISSLKNRDQNFETLMNILKPEGFDLNSARYEYDYQKFRLQRPII